MINKTSRIKFFSLVELMVAVAILVIMMGFLFQFAIGAQRIWSASNANAASFEDANIVFQFFEEDLKNIIFRDEETNPGRDIPLFYSADTTDKIFAFMTAVRPNAEKSSSDELNTGAYPVIYHYNSDSKQLKRLIWDTSISSTSPFFFMGNQAADYVESTLRNEFKSIVSSSSDTEILCRNIETFSIAMTPNSSTQGFATSPLSAVKVSFVLQVETTEDTVQEAANRRGFSKLIFLPAAN